MSIQVVGTVAKRGDEVVDPGTKTHKEAVAAAEAAAAGGPSVAVASTSFSVVALEFEGASLYLDADGRPIRLKQVDHGFSHGGEKHPAGDWVGKYEDGDQEVVVLTSNEVAYYDPQTKEE